MPKDNLKKELDLKIEKLSNLGLGIAHNDGKVIFVDQACPKDWIKVKVIKENKNYSIAESLNILKPSPFRINPKCPLQKTCGSCQIQFINYDYQLELKKQIIEDTMKSILGRKVEVGNVVPSPKIWECRRKIQFAVRQTQNSKSLKIGYYKNKTHEIVNIKYCPVCPKICLDIINYIREISNKFEISGYDEKIHQGNLRHVIMRSSASTGEVLLTLVVNEPNQRLECFVNEIYNKFPEISGICINYNKIKTNLILSGETHCLIGKNFITEALCDIDFFIESNTFFQVNPESADNLFRFVKNHVSSKFQNPEILDAYAGITAFGFALSSISKKITSVEECLESVNLARNVMRLNNINNVELNLMDAGKFFEHLSKINRKFDIVILDPPRKGCSLESLKHAIHLAKHEIIYVSCNPATLARDLKILEELGGKVDLIQPFDMFCHTYHVESVAIISL